MKRSFLSWGALLVALGFALPAFTTAIGHAQQSEDQIQETVESIERLVEGLEGDAEEMGEHIEAWMEEHAGEFEKWAEEHAGQWERWAEKFEEKFERWAEDQEEVWEDWAEEYEEKWEQFAEEIESGDFDPEKINQMLKRNLRMIGDMPLGQMVDGLMKNGSEGFESAPWSEMEELQSMLQKSIQQSVKEAEQKIRKAQATMQQRVTDAEGGVEFSVPSIEDADVEFILPVIEKQQKGLKAKEQALAREAQMTMEKIRDAMRKGDMDPKELKEQLQSVIRKQLMEKRQGLKMKASKSNAVKDKLRMEQHALEKRIATEVRKRQAEQKARKEKAQKRLTDSIDRVRNADAEAGRGKQTLERLYRSLEKEEREIQQKNRELEELQREIKRLRQEVEEMKADKDRDGRLT